MHPYIIKVKYLESLLTILFVHLLFFFYNDYKNKIYLILYYLICIRYDNCDCVIIIIIRI